MIFGNETISAYSRTNVTIWMILAFQAGVLNIGGYLACHSFVSHVTGFATLFGLELNRAHYRAALCMVMVPAFFLLGAMLSGFLIDSRLQTKRKPKYHIVFGVLFLLLLSVVIGGFNGFFGVFGNSLETTGDYTLLAVLCLACGVQNGMVSLVSRSVVRTTHLTGVTTDLGIGLARVLSRSRSHKDFTDEMRANFMRIGVILFFILGSIVGVELFNLSAFRGFILPVVISGLLYFATFYFQVIREVFMRKPGA